jgi:hypothetical protein
MIADPALRVVVTVLFGFTAVYCAWRVTRPVSVPVRGTYAAHLLMSVAMIVMAWPGGVGLLAWPQLVLFGAAAVWFTVLALSFGRAWALGAHHALHGRLVYWYHAVMMAAMVWMLVVMDQAVLGLGVHSASGHKVGRAAMAGMDMSGTSGGTAVVVVAWVLGLLFCVAGLAWLGSLVPEGAGARARSRSRASGPARAAIGYETVMAAGMAIASFAFL